MTSNLRQFYRLINEKWYLIQGSFMTDISLYSYFFPHVKDNPLSNIGYVTKHLLFPRLIGHHVVDLEFFCVSINYKS